jgi:tRNA (guanine37-N1)-methyltransferase
MSAKTLQFDIVTIFPQFFGKPPRDGADGAGILGHGILERALRQEQAAVATHDLRAFTHDRHRTVDDRPFGGGEGMVLKPQPIFECLESLGIVAKADRPASERIVLLSAQGRRFDQTAARRLASLDRVVLICGRYEGVDERVSQLLCDEELSIGDFVLSGGELAAAVIIDATVRLLPGVLGHADSSKYESFGEGDPTDPTANAGAPGLDSETLVAGYNLPRATHASGGLLDYPHYTRPAEWQGLAVPEELSGGDHLAVRRWRRQAALAKTLANRPDLLHAADLSDDDREYLASLGFHP